MFFLAICIIIATYSLFSLWQIFWNSTFISICWRICVYFTYVLMYVVGIETLKWSANGQNAVLILWDPFLWLDFGMEGKKITVTNKQTIQCKLARDILKVISSNNKFWEGCLGTKWSTKERKTKPYFVWNSQFLWLKPEKLALDLSVSL